uniref:Radical SAM protein n=1 Tax=candidate division WOR-3 bacterium TaxID=2052148 RepID=A0A7C6A8T1_UNCW3
MAVDFDPRAKALKIKPLVIDGDKRKYYRIARPGRWYGGIATADCVGCNLNCVFCWSNEPRDNPEKIGKFYSPNDVFFNLTHCAQKHHYKLLRISGNEPTLHKEHLLQILERVEKSGYHFILETNGTLIDETFARDLKGFRSLEVRVSLKGTTNEEFGKLTEANPFGFDWQIQGLANLVKYNVRCHPAVMLSFSPKSNLERLKNRLKKIKPKLSEMIEEEYIFLYPHVVKKLKQKGLKPLLAFSPNNIPQEFI